MAQVQNNNKPEKNPHSAARRQLLNKNSSFAVREAYKTLRTNIRFMLRDHKCKRISITSGEAGEGKSITLMNMAISLSEDGQKVLLIDADMRRPAVSRLLVEKSSPGLSEVLSNVVSWEEAIRPEVYPKLDILLSGEVPPNPTEMILSQRLDELITELRQHYDYIVIDSVPAMTIADAMILDRIADLAIYVIRQGGLDRRLLPDIEQLYREHKFRNMGIVLNDVTTEGQGYGYGYENGYYGGRHELSLWQRIKHKFGHKA